MATLLRLLIVLPVGLVLLLLALANRGPVTLAIDPLMTGAPLYAVPLPVFAALLGAVMVGVVLGGFATWFAQGRYRRAARQLRRENQRLASEEKRLRTMLPATASLMTVS